MQRLLILSMFALAMVLGQQTVVNPDPTIRFLDTVRPCSSNSQCTDLGPNYCCVITNCQGYYSGCRTKTDSV